MSASSLLVMLAGNICYVVAIAIMPGLAFPPYSFFPLLTLPGLFMISAGIGVGIYGPARRAGAVVALIGAVLAAPGTLGGLGAGLALVAVGAYLAFKEAAPPIKTTYTSPASATYVEQRQRVEPLCVYVQGRPAEGWRVYVTQRGEYVIVTPGGREAYSLLLEKDAVEFLSRTLGASAEEVKFAACP